MKTTRGDGCHFRRTKGSGHQENSIHDTGIRRSERIACAGTVQKSEIYRNRSNHCLGLRAEMETTTSGHSGTSWRDENVLKLDFGDGFGDGFAESIPQKSLHYTLKMGECHGV